MVICVPAVRSQAHHGADRQVIQNAKLEAGRQVFIACEHHVASQDGIAGAAELSKDINILISSLIAPDTAITWARGSSCCTA
jgi:hypothetical protein